MSVATLARNADADGPMHYISHSSLNKSAALAREHVAEEIGDDVILMMDEQGRVIGVERLNYQSKEERRLAIMGLSNRTPARRLS